MDFAINSLLYAEAPLVGLRSRNEQFHTSLVDWMASGSCSAMPISSPSAYGLTLSCYVVNPASHDNPLLPAGKQLPYVR
nr:MAG TPA: hypothetical protein [Caudoviricetes sp.]